MAMGLSSLGGVGIVGDIVAYVRLGGADQFNREMDQVNKQVTATGQLMNKAMNASIIAGAPAFGLAVTKAAQFEAKMADVNTLLGKDSKEAFKKLNEQVLELSTQVPLSAIELSDALYQIVSATVPASEAMFVLEAASKAAIGGVANVTDTFNLGSAIVKGYALEWSQLNDVYDIVFQTIKLGQTTMSELSTTMGGSIPLASTLGVSLEELSGAIATLTGVTGNTAEVMTQIEGIMTALAKEPTENLADAFENLGVASGRELIEKFGTLSGAMTALKGYTEEYGLEVTTLLGRKEAMIGFLSLTGAQAQDFANKTRAMYEATNESNQAFEIQMQTFKNQASVLKNIVTKAFIEYGNAVLPTLKNTFEWLNKNATAIQGVAGVMLPTIVTMGSVALGFKGLNTVVAIFGGTIDKMMTGKITLLVGALALIYNIVDKNVDKWQEAHQTLLDNIDSQSIAADRTEVLAARYKTLSEKQNLTTTESGELKKITDELNTLLGQVGLTVDDLNGNYEQTIILQRQMRKEEINSQLRDLELQMEKVNKGSSNLVLMVKALIDPMRGYAGAAYDANDKMIHLYDIQAALKKELEELSRPIRTVSGDMEDLANNTDDVNTANNGLKNTLPTVRDLTDSLAIRTGEFKGKLVELGDSLGNTETKTKDAGDEFADYAGVVLQALDNVAGLDDTTRNFANFMVTGLTQALKGTLDPLSLLTSGLGLLGDLFDTVTGQGEDFNDMIRRNINGMRNLKDYTDDLYSAESILAGAGIETEAAIRAQIAAYEDLFPLVADGSYEYEQLLDILSELYAKLGETSPWDEAAEAEEELEAATDAATQAILEQISKLEAMRVGLDPTSGKYKTLTDQINDLYYELGRTNPELEEQRQIVEGLSYAITELALSWEDALNVMFQEFDIFEANLRAVSRAIQQLLYFNIDLDTTSIDEQIDAAIQQMLDYLDTLDPDSQAYKDAKESLYELLMLYIQLGKPVSFELSAYFNEAELKALKQQWYDYLAKEMKIPVNFTVGEGGRVTLLHEGGIVEAHRGLMLGSYRGRNETLVKALEGETILRPDFLDKYGSVRVGEFINTLDPSSLTRGQRTAQPAQGGQPQVIIHEASPRTWAEIVDKSVYPRMKYKERRMETPGSPF